MKPEFISTRTVGQRIRRGQLPEHSDGGKVRCACHPKGKPLGDTEALRFWSKGNQVFCPVRKKWVPALAEHASLGIVIDTRL